MRTDGQNPTSRRRWRAALAILVVVVGGLLLGAGVALWRQNPPFEQRSTARLIRDLKRTDSPLDHLQQTLWPMVPDFITERFSRLSPLPASDVRHFATRRHSPCGK